MPNFKGSNQTVSFSTAYTSPCNIVSFSVTNKDAGAVTINVTIAQGSTGISIVGYNKSLAATEAYVYTGKPILLEAGWIIGVQASANVDFLFTIKPVNE